MCAVACCRSVSHAVLLYDSPSRNTVAPTGPALAAWNTQGDFGVFSGTPIAPNLFVAARHIGGSVGQTFTYGGQGFATSAFTDIAGSDIRVWQINTSGGGFGTYASLYDPSQDGSETGKAIYIFGRGTARGAAYYADAANTDLRGWQWGASDALRSYGQNVIDQTVVDDDVGALLAFDFDGNASRVPNEAALSSGDSSGGVFIFSRGEYRLAGVNYGVDGAWSRTEDGPFVDASIFDARGLFVGNTGRKDLVPVNLADSVPGSSYASQISAHQDELNAIFLATGNAALVPEPTACVAAVAAVAIAGTRRRR